MQFIINCLIILALVISLANCCTPEPKRRRLDDEGSSSYGYGPPGWTEIQAIDRYLRNLPGIDFPRVGDLEPNIGRMLDLIQQIGPELMETLDEDQADFPFCGCNYELLQQMAMSLQIATHSCDTETLNFLQLLIGDLLTESQYLHAIAGDLMDACLLQMSGTIASRIARSLGKANSSDFSLINRISRKLKQVSKDSSLILSRGEKDQAFDIGALRSMRLIGSRGRQITDILIEMANDRSIVKYSEEDLIIRLRAMFREQILDPCEDIISRVDSLTKGFMEYDGAMDLLNEALELERRNHPDIQSEIEIYRICREIQYFEESIRDMIEQHFPHKPSSSKER